MAYKKESVETFLRNQHQLFDEPVAETYEEAEEVLEDCLAVEVNSIREVRRYLDESGMDVEGMSDEELLDASEVFALEDGTFLIVEG
ncbi:MAG TPA: glyoxalase [Candidatus Egerieimonas faecigallinarum]|nr:glyoxalase [Candidatus Egerieimonas faecigallinarum]